MPNPQPPTASARGRRAEARANTGTGRTAAGAATRARAATVGRAAPAQEPDSADGLAAAGALALTLRGARDAGPGAPCGVQATLQAVIDAATLAGGASFGAFLYRPAPAPADAQGDAPAVATGAAMASDAAAPLPAAGARRDTGGADAARPDAASAAGPDAASAAGPDATRPDATPAAPLIAFAGVASSAAERFDPAHAAADFDAAWSAARTLRCPDVTRLAHADAGPPADAVRAQEPRVRSLLAVPVAGRDGTIAGGLFIAHPEADRFGAHAQSAVEAIAAQAALALDNLRLEDGIRRAAAERRELVDAARRARRESARAAHIKDEFLATLSHELRTPLTAILGWAKVLLLQHSDASTQARGLEAIARNANAQAELIETLLDMSRIVAGEVRLDVRPTDLERVIDDALEAIRPAAQAKAITLARALDPLACPVQGDAARLQQLVWNLLSNAVKFTPRQGRVEVTLARADGELELAVSDTGAGIAPEFLPHVFDCFRQADATTTRRHGGLGLGLAIVRQLATLHGGTVSAFSAGADRGTRFVVRLPREGAARSPAPPPVQGVAARAQAPASTAGAFCETDLHGLDLLVVDDQTDARELVAQLLVECGATVRQAASAAEALREVIARAPDVLLSDIGMPERDGYELIREIRRLAPAEGGEVPALALTAFARPDDRERALAAGYQGHLVKPVQPHALVGAVARLAGRPGAQPADEQPGAG
jgi:signal transduction histidine kinase/ActR/RegA family two-component response regulator